MRTRKLTKIQAMDRISELPDEVLIKILNLVETKVAVSTSALSKRWEFLWMLLPKLTYSTKDYSESDCESLRSFLHRNLPLHRAPVLERFCLKFHHSHLEPLDVKLWVLAVVSRCLRELKINYSSHPDKQDILPSSLYACKFLVTLKLKGSILVDVPRMVSLSCLKTLQLIEVTYLSEDSLERLLSICPVLEDLMVNGHSDDNLEDVVVLVPSLERLTLDICSDIDEFVIKTPSLKYLKLKYYNSWSHYFSIKKMSKLREAHINVSFPYMKKLIKSITCVKELTFCAVLNSLEDDVYGDGFVFNQLEHLKLCICEEHVSRLLVRLLKDSPKLQVLELFGMENHSPDGVYFWNQPSTVPECMLSSLKTFKWSGGYLGRPEERDLATFILQNAHCLQTATILSESSLVPKLDMLKELALSPRASTACRLVFKDL
ncbi:unnamed protein product [Microthlaspi erraticum]|uniref:F-box domain-containing protein n=1 Tax=Microthlaspi erraticum TaxID=1685480 RepID=A0A6D2KF19_9BRAS|nr:unnamed protein product [Microthlaspi erraticum]